MAYVGRVRQKSGAHARVEQLLLLVVTDKTRAAARRVAYARATVAAAARRRHARARDDGARGLVVLLGGRAPPKLGYRVLYGDHELFKRRTTPLFLLLLGACRRRPTVRGEGRGAGGLRVMQRKRAIFLQIVVVQEDEVVIARASRVIHGRTRRGRANARCGHVAVIRHTAVRQFAVNFGALAHIRGRLF